MVALVFNYASWGLNIVNFSLEGKMYKYLSSFFRVIGITLRGFRESDRPYARYDFHVFSDDIKVVLVKLKIKNARFGGF